MSLCDLLYFIYVKCIFIHILSESEMKPLSCVLSADMEPEGG